MRFELPPLRDNDTVEFIKHMANLDKRSDKLLELLVQAIPTNPRKVKNFINNVELQWATLSNTGSSEIITKGNVLEWFILNVISPSFCSDLKSISDDSKKIEFIDMATSFANASQEDRENMLKSNKSLIKFSDDTALIQLLKQGTFQFTETNIGILVHLTQTHTGVLFAGDPIEILNNILSEFTEREKGIIVLKYGLEDERFRALGEIANEFNITRNTARNYWIKTLRKLRHPSRSRILKAIVDSGMKIPLGYTLLVNDIFGDFQASKALKESREATESLRHVENAYGKIYK